MMHRGFMQKIFTAPCVIVHSENMQQCRFARAGRPHHGDEVAFLDFQVDVAQNVKKLFLRKRITPFEIAQFNHLF
jgi:hypothetical protein